MQYRHLVEERVVISSHLYLKIHPISRSFAIDVSSDEFTFYQLDLITRRVTAIPTHLNQYHFLWAVYQYYSYSTNRLYSSHNVADVYKIESVHSQIKEQFSSTSDQIHSTFKRISIENLKIILNLFDQANNRLSSILVFKLMQH